MTEIPDTVTICITSCNRLDLLTRTLSSFRNYNAGGKYLLSEDSGSEEAVETISARFRDVRILGGASRLGLMGSVDRLYSQVQSPYIFHLEDDWEFDGPVGWDVAIKALEQNEAISQVCVRSIDEIRSKYLGKASDYALDGHNFKIMSASAHPEFFGWSTNPGLMRTDLYRRYAPFGRVMHDQMSALIKRESGTMAFLTPGVARHIGQSRNVTDPTMPERPKSRPAKWMRGIKKKLYYLGLRKEPF